MTDVFLSYSRKDKPFVQSLYDALQREQRETWVDWDAIEYTEDWWQAIERGIEGTSTFVFMISPDSVASDVCRREIDHAVKHHKRLVPIVHREGFEISKVHPMLSKYNWLFFRQTDDFAHGFGQLMTAIDTDLEQVRTHTRILEKAIEWDKEGRNPSFVLRGEDLVRSQAWLVQADQKEPKPTELQREYISASQTNEEAAAILLKAGQQAKRLVQIGSGVLVATLIGASVAGWLALRATQKADQKVTTAQQQADAITQEADRQVRAADAKLEAAEKKTVDAQTAVKQAKAEQTRVLAQSEQQIREAQGRSAQAEQRRKEADAAVSVAEVKLNQANESVKLAETQQKVAEALQVEAKAGTQIERLGAVAIRRFETDQADGLRLAMQAGFELQKWGQGKSLDQYPALSPILALQSGLEKIKETRLPGNQRSVNSVAFSSDGSRLATGGEDGSIKLWDKDGKAITTLPTNQRSVNSVAFSSDGSRLATGGSDGSTKLWDKDGKAITTLPTNQGSVYSMAFSPDGSRLATGGFDGSIKLWGKDGKAITTFTTNQGSVYIAVAS
ncbi:toll/interleukin-1 receptor domain-containing protein [Phormidesmis priestleyi]|uniref:toll/interleukin-1 receptor domain-containing protein n=1 Tax=Phormidesmis priestleyi TaxID=268141 RepID=UPI00083A7BC0|nr:TIR domain-containing protein [Phormidesmis priestleyi]